MLILYSWLKEFIDLKLSPEDLAKHFVTIGFEVASMRRTGASFTGVRVAEIQKICKHPNADKLSLCEVNDGAGYVTVVCGAKNIAVGQKVPLAREGAKLPGGILKKAKIRGIESEGMICSASELGLENTKSEGIMVLDPHLRTGSEASDFIAAGDCLFDLEILPNRSDCLSHMGIARELCIYFGLPLRKPALKNTAGKDYCIPINVENYELCRRYCALIVKNVKAVVSPPWLTARIEAMGAKPRNILVDTSNYVLYELGQPLHVFDMDVLEGPEIKVRPAQNGEKLLTLEGSEITLSGDSLIIADIKNPIALAGIMGGLKTAVSEKTSNALIESAVFNPASIHRTSKHFGIKTESSYRFERGVDPETADYACRRAAEIIAQACAEAGLNPEISKLLDKYPSPPMPSSITITPERINSLLGTNFTGEKIFSVLKNIQPSIPATPPPWTFTPPPHRKDLENPCDLAEETARLAGYDIIPGNSANMRIMRSHILPSFCTAAKIKRKLTNLGLSEIYTYDFISEKDILNSGFTQNTDTQLANPISPDWEYLRPSLAPGLLRALLYNLHRGQESVCIFETGAVYGREADEIRERTNCAGLLYGRYPLKPHWDSGKTAELDFFHLKGVINCALDGFKGFEILGISSPPEILHPGLCMNISKNSKAIGWLGKIHPLAAEKWAIKNPNIWLFEFNIDALSQTESADFFSSASKAKPASQFPSAWRDISILLDCAVKWSEIEPVVKECPCGRLSDARLIDLYEGKNLPAGMKSLTIRLYFRLFDRTLTDKEIDESVNMILERLSKAHNAKLRT